MYSSIVSSTGPTRSSDLIRPKIMKMSAIETAAYFAACGQTGFTETNGEKRACYGHSLVADPWGMLVAQASDGEGYVTATLDKEQNQRVQNLIPVGRHRRLSC